MLKFLVSSLTSKLPCRRTREKEEAMRRMQDSIALTKLIQRVAVAANEAASIPEGLQAGIEAICDYTQWEVGHAYLFSEERQKLESLNVWKLSDEERFKEFRAISTQRNFAPGDGFIGEVYADSTPMWILDVASSNVYRRKESAQAAGLKAAFAFPVFVGRKAVAVIEFYSLSSHIPEEHLLSAMANIGKQLGQVIERYHFMEHAKLLETIITSANDAILLTTASAENPEIIYVNEAFTRLSGYEPHEVIGHNPSMLQGEFTCRETTAKLGEALRTGVPFKSELLNYKKTGEHYWLEISIVPIRDASGAITHFAAIERDITERKASDNRLKDTMVQLTRANMQAEAAARQLQDSLVKAEEANRAKSNFLANMSHELRTPMNGVLGMAHLLADTPLSRDQIEYVSTINGSAETLLMLLNDILDFSKIEAGALELENIPYGLPPCLLETASLLKIHAEGKNIPLLVQCEPDLPAYLWGDPGRLRQIVTNLISNAVKFTDTGYVRLAAKLCDYPSGRLIHVSVEDTGIGIPEAKLATIFDKFTQADTSVTRKYGGTGLGLAITKNLVEMMGGTIGVESAPGKGSTFWFRIPCAEATAQEYYAHRRIEHRILDEGAPRKPLAEARALLVEDTPVNQIFAQKLLKKFGFTQIDLAENGEEALQRYRTIVYDVIFMDCQMPQMDGYQAAGHIRKIETDTPLHTPIVAMTANAMIGDREKCLKAGMDDYVSKPLKPDHLQVILEQWFELGGNSMTPTQKTPAAPAVQPVVTALTVPATIAEETQAPVDLEQLRLFTDGDAEEEKALIELFMEQANEALRALDKSLELKDDDQWKSMSHLFKGASGNFGAMHLHHLCKRAEQHHEEPLSQKSEMLSAIRHEVERVRQFLQAA